MNCVDLDRYPLNELDGKHGRTLIARVRTQMLAQGACELPGFMSAQGLELAIAQSNDLATRAHPSRSRATAYLSVADAAFPASHPRAQLSSSSVRVVGYDQIPTQHVLRQLYEWQPLHDFVAAVLDLPRVYRYDDPMGALNIAVMGDGDELGWHFDQTDFVLSIPLVPAQTGGEFEVHPLIRTTEDERYEAVALALVDAGPAPLKLAMTPGSLLVFQGRHSLHRVTPIAGPRDRLVALLAYDRKPGTDSTAELKRARYGRTVPLSRYTPADH